MPRESFRVSVTKDYLVFASAHFITFAGHRCEGLHGHNYRVRVTLDGVLDPESWFVFDFVALKHIMRDLCDEIDHKVLLPLENPKIQIGYDGDAVTVAYEGKPRYVFPKGDCSLLPDHEHDRRDARPAPGCAPPDRARQTKRTGTDGDRDRGRGKLRPVGHLSHRADSAGLSRCRAGLQACQSSDLKAP